MQCTDSILLYILIWQLLRGYNNCPAYSALREADKTTQKYQQTEADNKVAAFLLVMSDWKCVYTFFQHFFDILANETGLEVVNLTNIWKIEDVVFIEVCTVPYKL